MTAESAAHTVANGARKVAGGGAILALTILLLINTLNFFDRTLLGALAEPVRREFMLSDTALGLLGTVFIVIYAFVGLPFGSLADKWHRTRLVALGTAFWSLLTAATGAAQTYGQIFLARLGVGIGEAACAPAAQSMIGDLFPSRRRALAMGIFMLGLPAGIFLAYLTAGLIGSRWGWRATFYLACLPGLILAALVLAMREPLRGTFDQGPAAGGAALSGGSAHGGVPRERTLRIVVLGIFRDYREVLRLPTMWWIILSGIFHNFNMYAINSFTTPFLQRYHELSLRQAGGVSSIAIGAVGAIGLLAGGWLGDRLSIGRRNGRLTLSAWCMAIAAPCIFFAVDQPKGALTAYTVLMTSGTITMYVYYATVYAAIQDVIEPRLRGTAVSIYFWGMYILGAGLGPIGMGMLSDHFARRAMLDAGGTALTEAHKAAGLHHAMYAIPIIALLAALTLFAASRTVGRDTQRRELSRQPLPSPT
jgi:MFS family permease